jgi:hypothetical protein
MKTGTDTDRDNEQRQRTKKRQGNAAGKISSLTPPDIT